MQRKQSNDSSSGKNNPSKNNGSKIDQIMQTKKSSLGGPLFFQKISKIEFRNEKDIDPKSEKALKAIEIDPKAKARREKKRKEKAESLEDASPFSWVTKAPSFSQGNGNKPSVPMIVPQLTLSFGDGEPEDLKLAASTMDVSATVEEKSNVPTIIPVLAINGINENTESSEEIKEAQVESETTAPVAIQVFDTTGQENQVFDVTNSAPKTTSTVTTDVVTKVPKVTQADIDAALEEISKEFDEWVPDTEEQATQLKQELYGETADNNDTLSNNPVVIHDEADVSVKDEPQILGFQIQVLDETGEETQKIVEHNPVISSSIQAPVLTNSQVTEKSVRVTQADIEAALAEISNEFDDWVPDNEEEAQQLKEELYGKDEKDEAKGSESEPGFQIQVVNEEGEEKTAVIDESIRSPTSVQPVPSDTASVIPARPRVTQMDIDAALEDVSKEFDDWVPDNEEEAKQLKEELYGTTAIENVSSPQNDDNEFRANDENAIQHNLASNQVEQDVEVKEKDELPSWIPRRPVDTNDFDQDEETKPKANEGTNAFGSNSASIPELSSEDEEALDSSMDGEGEDDEDDQNIYLAKVNQRLSGPASDRIDIYMNLIQYISTSPAVSDCLNVLNWFLFAYQKYPVNHTSAIIQRITIFAKLQRVLASYTETSISEISRRIFRLESFQDMLARCSSSVDFSTIEPTELNSNLKFVYSLAFVKPKDKDLEKIRSRFVSTKTRSNCYATMTLILQQACNWLKRDEEMEEYSDLVERMKWCILMLGENAVVNPPSSGQLTSLWQILGNLINVYEDSNRTIKVVRQELESQMNVPRHDCPPYHRSKLPLSALMDVESKIKSYQKNGDYNIPLANWILYYTYGTSIKAPYSGTVYVTLGNTWLEIDTQANRLLLSLYNFNSPEISISASPGTLQICSNELVWMGHAVKDRRTASTKATTLRKEETALRIKYREIKYYFIERVKISPDAVVAETNIMKAREQLNVSTSETRIETITGPILQAKKRYAKLGKKAELSRFKSTFSFTYPSQESIFFLSIITERENIRFYPIYEEEVVLLYEYLEKLTGIGPLPEKDIVKAVLNEKLIRLRYQVLNYLLKYPKSSWVIQTLDELTKLLRKLTDELSIQSVYDMERLFHSCRLESEVTKETISFLHNCWNITRSEDVQIKILNIMDRLLNKSVFRIGAPNTTIMYKWLRRLEDSVNPYKSPIAFQMIVALTKRLKSFQVECLPDLTVNEIIGQAEDWTNFSDYQKYLYGMI